ncbi:MAG TPA: hypothetical protein VFU22_32415 [Roseiflexaceae bacterium]|nr:hypothetical protein [Roseiflexaceae bacterium]
MDTTTIAQRLRTFLLVLAGWMCAGTIVELLLAEHTESLVQLIPFVLCGLGLIAVAGALLRPSRGTLIGLRAVMALLLVGSLIGVYEHFEGNLAFEMEIRPAATFGTIWLNVLKGAAPLLAPGILAVAAAIAIASTYYHPALARDRGARR